MTWGANVSLSMLGADHQRQMRGLQKSKEGALRHRDSPCQVRHPPENRCYPQNRHLSNAFMRPKELHNSTNSCREEVLPLCRCVWMLGRSMLTYAPCGRTGVRSARRTCASQAASAQRSNPCRTACPASRTSSARTAGTWTTCRRATLSVHPQDRPSSGSTQNIPASEQGTHLSASQHFCTQDTAEPFLPTPYMQEAPAVLR